MDRDDALRQRIARWVEAGFPQNKFADVIGRSESWFSRWLNKKDDAERSPSLIEADKLEAYLDRLQKTLLGEPGGEEFPSDQRVTGHKAG